MECFKLPHPCWPRLERSAGIFGHCHFWVQNDTAVYCGWGSKPTWNGPHFHTKHLKFAVDGDMDPLPQLLSALIWEVNWNLWYLMITKWYWQEMVEALNPHWMVPTHPLRIKKASDKLYMLSLDMDPSSCHYLSSSCHYLSSYQPRCGRTTELKP